MVTVAIEYSTINYKDGLALTNQSPVTLADVTPIKTAHGVPESLRTCHTALVGGYVVEGHVPAADIHRLLKERPAGIAGIGARGMPIGSPGMEVEGVKPQPYEVLAFDKQGKTRVFARH